MKPNILLLETVSKGAQAILDQHSLYWLAPSPEKGLAIDKLYGIDAIVTRGKGKVDIELINACNQLRVIARCGVGLDNIHVEHASSKGIPVINAPGANASTVAEHTLALMLMSIRKLDHYTQAVKVGRWAYRNNYDGDELRGKTLGILGLGDIGSRVATLAHVFGMKVLFWNRNMKKDSPFRQVELQELYAVSDIISIHLPLTEQTTLFINDEAISKMKKQPLLINTSRGQIVDELALRSALKAGTIAGYAADLIASDPEIPNHPLLSLDQVIITPHIASLTASTYDHMCQLTVQNVVKILSGNPIDNKYIFNKSEL